MMITSILGVGFVAVQERLGMLFILVGPGGVGKNALMGHILDRIPQIKQLPTATTRSPRGNEQHGIHHLFITQDEFRQMIANGDLLEHQEVHPGKFYGVPRTTIEDAIHGQQDLIADIEFKGATILRSAYPENTLAIFVAPPSLTTLKTRLRDRQDSADDIRDRLNRLSSEMVYAPTCDYVIVNDSFDVALAELLTIIQQARGEATEEAALLHTVEFSVEVYPVLENSILIPIEGDGQPLKTILQRGETPALAAHRLLQSIWPDANPSDLDYSAPNDDHLPVDFDINPTNHHYNVCYRYTYIVQQPDDIAHFIRVPIQSMG
jgi:guanylate kinase